MPGRIYLPLFSGKLHYSWNFSYYQKIKAFQNTLFTAFAGSKNIRKINYRVDCKSLTKHRLDLIEKWFMIPFNVGFINNSGYLNSE